MTSPCYRCHERRPKCHAECEAYRVWKRALDESREPAHMVTDAHEKKINSLLRQAVKDRTDGRGNHTGD